MISPEYNHGMSGVLKNALDWASRPHGRSVLKSKPVLTMTASPAFTGGVRAQQQMNETLASIPARPVFRPQIVIGGVHEKVRDGRLIDQTALSFALEGVGDLIEEIRAATLFARRHERHRRCLGVSPNIPRGRKTISIAFAAS
jgi:chromate reductase